MEFFYANEIWSGVVRIISNIYILNTPTTVNHLVDIFIDKEDAAKLKEYLSDKQGSTFENKLEFEFYCGTPVDCYMEFDKFEKVCKMLGIKPSIKIYSIREMRRFQGF